MKRSLSDSDSEDIFDDDLKSSSPSQSCHVTDRKKRRGIIEKRRRDRINHSLSELRRLVPTAFEKQGSAKLEKAEILQMTVDHLKMLHQKGINGYNYPDPHSLAVDYRGIGFRECASEVARYLVTVEGMDLQDPLRLRLLGHLQCFSATKASIQTSSWTSMTSHPTLNTQYSGNSMASMTGMLTSQHSGQSDPLSMSSHSTIPSGQPVSYSESRLSQSDGHVSSSLHSHMRSLTSSGGVGQQLSGMASAAQVQQISPPVLPGLPQLHSQFPVSLNSMMSPTSNHSYSNSLNQHPSVKPYRPWGAELAY